MNSEAVKKQLKDKQDIINLFENQVSNDPIVQQVLLALSEKHLVEKSPYGKIIHNIFINKLTNTIKNSILEYYLRIWKISGFLIESRLNLLRYNIKTSSKLTRKNFDYLMYLPSTHPTDYGIMFPIIKKMDELRVPCIVVTTTTTYKRKYNELSKLENSEFIFLDNEFKSLNLFSLIGINEKVKHQFSLLSSHITNNDEILGILTQNKNFVLYKLKIQEILRQIYFSLITRYEIKRVVAVSLSGGLLKASLESGIRTIRLQHAGGYDDILTHPNEDTFVVWGRYYQEKIRDKVSSKINLVPLGCPKFDVVPNLKKKSKGDIFYKKFDLDKSKTTIVFFSKFHGAGLTEHSFSKILEELKNLFNKFHDEINLIIKLHPSEDKTIYLKTLDESMLAKVTILKNEVALYDLLRYCDVAVALPSTTILEAIAFDVPVVQIHFADYLNVLDFHKYGGGIFVRNRNEFISTINKLLTDEKYREEIIRKQREFIDYSLTNLGSATEKIVEYVLKSE